MKQIIYMDNAATTPVLDEVLETMLPYFKENFGNPSSIYSIATQNKREENTARSIIAQSIGAKPEEIYFTSGGTEADNWALVATAEAYEGKGKHIVTATTEHHAIMHTCKYLEKRGFSVTYVNVDEKGVINLEELKSAIREDTVLVSVMYANNEIGVIQPIKEIAQIVHEKGALFHTDAVQAYCQIPINIDEDGIDMMSASAHKLNGPKGVGFLYIRKGIKTRSFMHGGSQERKRRAGTENVPGIVGFAKAVEIGLSTLEDRRVKEIELRDYLINRVLSEIEHVRLNGCAKNRLPGNANFSFRFVEGESLLLRLDMSGICASSGSACTSGSLDPSHVLLGIGLTHEIAHGSLRLTLSERNTKEEVDYVVESLKEIIASIRAMSPLYEDYLKKNKK